MQQSRRHFLQTLAGGSALVSLSGGAPGFLARAAANAGQAGDPDGRVLVVLQLSGGNDGLNCVVPYAHDAYQRARPTLRLNGRQVLRLNDELGLHPRLAPFRDLLDEGRLAVAQGVGCAKLSRNHDAALRTWHVADPQPANRETGWVGRAADALEGRPDSVHEAALFVGNIPRPFALNAEAAACPVARSLSDLLLRQPLPTETASVGPALLARLRQAAAEARSQDARLAALRSVARTQPARGYPDFGLARDLRLVATLIRAELGTRIFFVELGGGGIGGFDNHANQKGNHDALLDQLSRAVAAFARDLADDGLLDRVLLMTFSEFGRTLAENGRHGTGHGEAAPVFLMGGHLRPGLHGDHPSLTDLDQGALRHHTDFRQLYATVLDRWLHLDAKTILGAPFPWQGVSPCY